MANQSSVLNHIALLVPNAEKSAAYLQRYQMPIGPAEEWEGEGTLEIYVGDRTTQMGRLLLMEPIKPGAYTRAMEKRGPGLHHIAIDVLEIEHFIEELSGSGWLMHPKSLRTLSQTQTIYLARPGIPTLIEVQQREQLKDNPHLISEMSIPGLTTQNLQMFAKLGLTQIKSTVENDLVIVMNDVRISFQEFI